MSFLKRLFGGGDKPAPPQPAAAEPDPRDVVQQSRDAARVIRRQLEPLKWAEAQQLLANNLIALSAAQTGGAARSSLEEAESILYDALEAADHPDAHPAFTASLTYLWGYAAWQKERLLDGDAKGHALADAANRFTEAFNTFDPATHYDMWVTLGFYRGAVFHELAELQKGAQSLGWYDEAIAAFKLMEGKGSKDGGRHPMAAYNSYVVLEARARLTEGPAALAYLVAAKEALKFAMRSSSFAAAAEDHRTRLAALNAEIAGRS